VAWTVDDRYSVDIKERVPLPDAYEEFLDIALPSGWVWIDPRKNWAGKPGSSTGTYEGCRFTKGLKYASAKERLDDVWRPQASLQAVALTEERCAKELYDESEPPPPFKTWRTDFMADESQMSRGYSPEGEPLNLGYLRWRRGSNWGLVQVLAKPDNLWDFSRTLAFKIDSNMK